MKSRCRRKCSGQFDIAVKLENKVHCDEPYFFHENLRYSYSFMKNVCYNIISCFVCGLMVNTKTGIYA